MKKFAELEGYLRKAE